MKQRRQRPLRRWSERARACVLACACVLQAAHVDALPLWAQQPDERPDAAQVQPAKGYAVEWMLVILLAGGALYSVCRSSRRS